MMAAPNVRIETDAIQALLHWKSVFAEEVVAGAILMAARSKQPGLVTKAQYRKAAKSAINALSKVIQDGETGENQAA